MITQDLTSPEIGELFTKCIAADSLPTDFLKHHYEVYSRLRKAILEYIFDASRHITKTIQKKVHDHLNA